jgi:hypothetical protein
LGKGVGKQYILNVDVVVMFLFIEERVTVLLAALDAVAN